MDRNLYEWEFTFDIPKPVRLQAKRNFMNDFRLCHMEPMHSPAQSIQLTELWEIISHYFKSMFWRWSVISL